MRARGGYGLPDSQRTSGPNRHAFSGTGAMKVAGRTGSGSAVVTPVGECAALATVVEGMSLGGEAQVVPPDGAAQGPVRRELERDADQECTDPRSPEHLLRAARAPSLDRSRHGDSRYQHADVGQCRPDPTERDGAARMGRGRVRARRGAIRPS